MTVDRPAHWTQDLGTGAPGLALAAIEAARTGTGTWSAVDRWATTMLTQPVIADPAAFLYRGAPAVAYALHTANRPQYESVLAGLDAHINRGIRIRLEAAHDRIASGHPPAMREYDLIRGLTGLGTYLWHRHRGGDLLLDVLVYLVRLARPVEVGGVRVPGWWTCDGPEGLPSDMWPGGHCNLGMAHGLGGPLALLATTMRHGVTVPRQDQAIRIMCGGLDRCRTDTDVGPWWPETIPLARWATRTPVGGHAGRPSWCYGTPGLARAQQLAGIALQDAERQRHAVQALAGCLTDEKQLSHLNDASLCHGWSGLLRIAERISDDDTSDTIASLLPDLHARRSAQLDLHGLPAERGFLVGREGARLTQRHTTRATWDTCLLIGG
jgi:lantibiotic biosynthesis protein